MERVMNADTFTKAEEDATGMVVEGDSDATDYKLQPPSKSVCKPLSDMRSKMESALADIGVQAKNELGAIVEIRRSKWTHSLQLEIIKDVQSTFEDALTASFFNSNN